MADEKDNKRLTGTVKYLDNQGIGYITPDIEVLITPSSLSSKTTIKEGDRVEFSLKFNGKNPRFEAIDVVPVKFQCFNYKIHGQNSNDSRSNSRVKGSNNKSRFVKKKGVTVKLPNNGGSLMEDKGVTVKLPNNGESLMESSSNSKSSVVSVKRKEDVKKVEKVEDCFILEFDPTAKCDDHDDHDGGDDDCRSIVCVKNVEDVKKVEEVEDCFILEFDPDEPVKLGKLSLCDDVGDDVTIIAEKGKVACRDYPHPRNLCGTHLFQTTPHEVHCKMCYCYVCEKPAPCTRWTNGFNGVRHCDAIGDDLIWSMRKEQWKKGERTEGKM